MRGERGRGERGRELEVVRTHTHRLAISRLSPQPKI